MTKARHTSNLVDTNGDVKSSALDNVPASDNASALTSGTLPDARLSNQAKVVKGTSAPNSPQGGDLWYDTTSGVNLLKVYNSGSAIWVATNVISPILSSVSNIENGQAVNITLTGSNFGTGQGVVSFTPSGGSASTVNVTPTSDTSVTVAIPSAIYNQSVGTSIAITFQNAGGLTSAAVNKTVQVAITGGTKVISGGYTYHTFLSSGNFVLGEAKNIEYLIIAGGGSAGSYAGGGGAGGVLSGTKSSLSAGTYGIVVGAGGANPYGSSHSGQQHVGGDGTNSTGLSETAIGGGGGGDGGTSGRVGGSGGGGTYASGAHGGAGTSGQGNAGGNSNTQRTDPYASGGGGGKGSVGGTAASDTNAGAGGDGTNSFSAWATATSTGDGGLYAGGGGAGVSSGSGYNSGGVAGAAGTGGGGAGGVGGSGMTAGDTNTGGGGGSGGYNGSTNLYKPQNGGSGIVILRYQ